MAYFPMKGWYGEVRIIGTDDNASWFEAAPDPYCDRNPLSTSVSMEKVYVIGKKDPLAILEGEQEITGTIERPFLKMEANNKVAVIDGVEKLLSDLAGVTADEMIECKVRIRPNESSGQVAGYLVTGVKFSDWSLDLAAGDMTKEHCDFSGTSIAADV
ncbi:MAG: hypothetical protein KAX49_03850 [Halanaerobiales bacterium]|nr:hypothetical protein [Halanaerobiales bacterium]